MDVWSLFLMFGVTTLWAAMLSAVVVRIRLVRAKELQR